MSQKPARGKTITARLLEHRASAPAMYFDGFFSARILERLLEMLYPKYV
jgi:hypothetical protein